MTYHARTAYRNSTSTNHEFREGDIISRSNYYVINYAPIYSILEEAATFYNTNIKDKEWMYTDASLDQAMVALYLIQLSNPNNYTYADVKGDVQLCASYIKQAVAEYGKINLVKKTGSVTFKDNEGNVLQTYPDLEYGTVLDTDSINTDKTSVSYVYEFTGWNPEVTVVNAPETTYTAVYNITSRYYTITYLDANGTQLKTESVAYNNYPTPPALPTKAADEDYHYTAAWNATIAQVTGDATYTVVYTPVAHSGGTATCRTQAKCTVCQTYYGALGEHSYGELHAADPATCTANGTIAYYQCGVCGDYFNADKEPVSSVTDIAPGHNYGTWIPEQPASCTADGVKGHFHCSRCQKDFDADYAEIADLTIPAGHTYGEWINETPATCAAAGEKGHYHCSGCQKDFDAAYVEITDLVIPKADHQYGSFAPNGDGTHTRTCTVCPDGTDGHSVTEDCAGGTATCKDKAVCTACGGEYGEYAAHVYGEWIEETPASCDAAGEKAHYHCGVCGKDFDADNNEISDLAIPAAHNFGEWVNEVSATCAASGVKGHKHCSLCDKDYDADGVLIEDLAIPKAAHVYGDWYTVGDGTHARICENCPAGTEGHKQTEACYGGEATCTERAVCTVCGGEYGDDAGHVYGEWIAPKDASCTNAGWVGHYHCGVCGKDFDETYAWIADVTIPAPGHIYGSWIGQTAPGCTTPGEKGHYHCGVCGKNFDADHIELATIVLPAAHTPVYVEEIPATETENGVIAHYDCSVCCKHFRESACVHELTDAEMVIPATGGNETPIPSGAGICKFCGQYHDSSVWGRVSRLVHTILYMIMRMMGKA